jgi:SMC interacting uncharacterized protein involved in chromosome segregation
MGKDKEVYGPSKVPDSVIILTQLEEIKKLKQKNHEIVQKAKEREEHWKAYTEELLKTINGDTDEEKKLRREVKAIKKANVDYQLILEENQRLRKKNEVLRQQVKDLTEDLGNKPVSSGAPSRKEVMRQFNRMKNRRAIMDTLGFPYNEEMPIAFNAVNFFEWVRANRLWSNLYTAIEQLK